MPPKVPAIKDCQSGTYARLVSLTDEGMVALERSGNTSLGIPD
jgi:hypothetical protein